MAALLRLRLGLLQIGLFLCPFRIARPVRVSQIAISNGGTVSGNVDAGIYNADGTKLVSFGSTAQTPTSNAQTFAISATTLTPGLYYAALALSNATGQIFAYTSITAEKCRVLGLAQMASAFPLPATATFASAASAHIPVIVIRGNAHNYAGADHRVVAPPHIHMYSPESSSNYVTMMGGASLNSIASAAWPSANRAYLFGFYLTRRTRFQRLWIFNGSAVSGNFDLGVYSTDLNLITSSGSTAQAGTNQIQTVSIDIKIGPGLFYVAAVLNNTTGTTFKTTAPSDANMYRSAMRVFPSAFPLGTLTGEIGAVDTPLFGISQRTVV